MSLLDEFKLKCDEHVKTIETAKKIFEGEIKKEFRKCADEIFREFPDITSFSWRQYTPHFNDGDRCEFGVYADEPNINGEDYYDYVNENDDADILQTMISSLVYAIPYDTLDSMFGEGEIVVTRTSIETEDYDHD